MRSLRVWVQSSRRCTACATCFSSSSKSRPTWLRVSAYVAPSTTTVPRPRVPTTQSTRFARIDLTAASRERDDAVTHAAHVADELGLELAPEVMQVHLDAVAAHLLAPSIHRVLELLARNDRAGLLHQRLEHRELARRELDRRAHRRSRAAGGDAPRHGIAGERAARHVGRGATRLAPHDRARAGEELVEIER